MGGNKALQQQICICFLYLSSSSQQGQRQGDVVWVPKLPLAGEEEELPPGPGWKWREVLWEDPGWVHRKAGLSVPWRVPSRLGARLLPSRQVPFRAHSQHGDLPMSGLTNAEVVSRFAGGSHKLWTC